MRLDGAWSVVSMGFRPFLAVVSNPLPRIRQYRSTANQPEGAWLDRWPQSGRLPESAAPLEDRSQELAGHGDFCPLRADPRAVSPACPTSTPLDSPDLWLAVCNRQ